MSRAGGVEYLATGSGSPATLFLHGLTGSIAETRTFGSGVGGTRLFAHLRGHGGTALPKDADGLVPGSWADLATDLEPLVGAHSPTRLVGASAGACVSLRLLADEAAADPATRSYQRAVLALVPHAAAGHEPPEAILARYDAIADAVDAADSAEVARLLREHQPARVRSLPAVSVWSTRRASELVRTQVSHVLRAWPRSGPPVDPDDLVALDVPVLVLAHEDDEVHPVEVARALASALPRAELAILPPGGVPWCSRTALREIISGFLAGGRTRHSES